MIETIAFIGCMGIFLYSCRSLARLIGEDDGA
jgi:hypothetical protein